MTKRMNLSKEKLKLLYLDKKLTTYQIASKVGCCQATIWKNLIKYNIKRRKPYALNSNVPSKEILLKLYLQKKLSTWEIEKRYGYSRGTIHRKLKEFGIATRDRADSHILSKRIDFSADPLEKAYLIGFRIGDLGVRKIHPNSKTIIVASGSTIPEQIELIKQLFDMYGKVWIKKTQNNKINIYVNLNRTFDFLLSKNFPIWVLENEDSFFSFLAGFTDAEGCISFSKSIAYYSLGNSNIEYLKLIKSGLDKFEIQTNKIYSDKRMGKPTTEGYFFKTNYHQIRISKKKELLNLLNKIKPYIKHPNKIKALNTAIENINMRNKFYG